MLEQENYKRKTNKLINVIIITNDKQFNYTYKQ